jgi:hypothetical protein
MQSSEMVNDMSPNGVIIIHIVKVCAIVSSRYGMTRFVYLV